MKPQGSDAISATRISHSAIFVGVHAFSSIASAGALARTDAVLRRGKKYDASEKLLEWQPAGGISAAIKFAGDRHVPLAALPKPTPIPCARVEHRCRSLALVIRRLYLTSAITAAPESSYKKARSFLNVSRFVAKTSA
jgi:hypothetical protein